jgi:hypothetical protein
MTSLWDMDFIYSSCAEDVDGSDVYLRRTIGLTPGGVGGQGNRWNFLSEY